MSKKKLTQKQVYLKYKLLDETRAKIKGRKATEIRHIWEQYRGKKFTIENLPVLRSKKNQYKENPEKYEAFKEKYYNRKELKIGKAEFGTLKPEKREISNTSEQTFYKVLNRSKLDNAVNLAFEKKGAKYVLVIIKARDNETGFIKYGSRSFTIDGYKRVIANSENVLDNLIEKLESNTKSPFDDYTIISVHVRIIKPK